MSALSASAAVIGGGPAGLMAAEVLAAAGARVELFDAMPSPGRKFLLAGVGGMNITHSEPLATFLTRYGQRREQIAALLAGFGPQDLREWLHGLGIDTFVGSSGRIFPVGMKAAPLLRAWLQRLRAAGVQIHVRHRWLGWNTDGTLRFATPAGEIARSFPVCVLALGGGSWQRLGSDGAWVEWLAAGGTEVVPLRPANCGFDVAGWSEHLRTRYAGAPLKPVRLSFIDAQGERFERRGECVLTATGIEGSLVYAASSGLRGLIEAHGVARPTFDLAPDRDELRLAQALAQARGSRSLAHHLQRQAGLYGAKAALLREQVAAECLADPRRLAAAIKALPIELVATRPLDEAISSAGGVAFEALSPELMLHARPGVFCAGEMLDWEAPTGGYLLTACFASGRVAGGGAVSWLRRCGVLSEPVA